MKPKIVLFVGALAFTVAAMLLDKSVLSRTTTQQRAVGGDGSAVEIAKQPLIDFRERFQPPQSPIPPSGLINFLPADIFVVTSSSDQIENPYAFSDPLPATKSAPKSEDDPATLARKLHNPVSSLARIYFDNSIDFGMASNREGYRYRMNIEPVVPIALNKNWNLIVRTKIPLMSQDGIDASTVQAGLGDILQSFYVSPNNKHAVFWGVGTTLLIPTATDTHLGAGKFGIGPAAVIGAQHRAWTYGVVTRHIWSVAGHSDRADVSATYFEPFVSYTTRSAWTFSVDTESTYDWIGKRWSAPVSFDISKVLRVGSHAVSVGGGMSCWAATLPGGPQACGVRFSITPLFPPK